MDRMSRRQVIQRGAAGFLTAGSTSGVHAEAADGFSFVVVNDTHYVDEQCAQWLSGAVKQMRAHSVSPGLCLLVGDLVETGTPEHLRRVHDIFGRLGVPICPVPGNHDYGPEDDPDPYDDLFPGRRNYSFDHAGWQFIGLDTTAGLAYQNTAIGAATLRWLDTTLPRLDHEKPTVVFTHFPLGAAVTYRPSNAGEVLARLRALNVRAVFNGHFHGYTEREWNGVRITTNRCCSRSRSNHDGTKEKGYFLCRTTGNEVTRTFVEVPDGNA